MLNDVKHVQLTTRSTNNPRLSVSSQCGGTRAVSLACISSMLMHIILSLCFVYPLDCALLPPPSPPPVPSLYFPLIYLCDRCLVPLAQGIIAARCRFTTHGSITLSRGWLYQNWEPLDILGTHPHLAMQLLTYMRQDLASLVLLNEFSKID